MRLKISVNRISLYLGIFSIYSFFSIINASLLNIDTFYSFIKILTLLFLAISFANMIFNNKISLLNFSWIALTILFFLVAAYKTDRLYLIIYSLFIVCYSNIPFQKIVKTSFYSTALALIVVITLSLSGLLEDYIYLHGDVLAHSFGFGYYTAISFYVFYLMIMYFFLRKDKISWADIFLVATINYLVYYYTTTRLIYFLGLLLLLLVILVCKLQIINFRSNVFAFFARFSFPILSLLALYTMYAYDSSSQMWKKLDIIFNNRLNYSNIASKLYSLNLFGNKIEMVGNFELTYGNASRTSTTFYLDSGFNYSWLGYGILFTILVLGLYSLIFVTSYNKNDKYIYIWCILVALFTLINNTWINITYNPILFYVGQVFLVKRNCMESQESY